MEVQVDIYYKTYKDGPIATTYIEVDLDYEEMERLQQAGHYDPCLKDIYERIENEVGWVVDEYITENDGLWYYDFTEAFSENNPFSIFDTENTGYSMRIEIDFDRLHSTEDF